MGKHIYHGRKDLKYKSGSYLSLKFSFRSVMHTAESEFSTFMIEYLGEIETEFEYTLSFLSGACMDGVESWKIL